MARRETYEVAIRCPACGKTGTETRSENENPVHNRGEYDARLESVSDGFVAGARGKITCACGATVRP